MTLFKKVFQNQSQPASSDELLDEAALRQAFMDADEAPEPLNLDPFAKASEQEYEDLLEEDTSEQTNELEAEGGYGRGVKDETLEEHDQYDVSYECLDGNDGEEEAKVAEEIGGVFELTDVSETTASDGNEQQADVAELKTEQTDAEIAACLDRAVAAGALSTDESYASEAEVAAPPSETEENEDAGRSDEQELDVESGIEAAIEEATNAEKTAEEPEVDLTQFAQQQLAAQVGESSNAAEAADVGSDALDLSSHELGLEAVPAPAPGRSGRRAGRVKTRLIGFNRTGDAEHDPFGQAPEATATALQEKYPVGWLVIVEGPGVGHSFSLFTGASMIGRGDDQVIRLDFGDNSISRNNHAAIAYDEEQNKFYIGHGGKSNIIRRNARPVLSTEELHHADLIRIGETTLRFVALCGSDFQWHNAGGINDDRV